MSAELLKFLFEGLPVRGRLVRLEGDWRDLLARRNAAGGYPGPVRSLLGEMTAAAVLMQSNLAFDGQLILQIQGDGPVKLAVAECGPTLEFRATATMVGEVGEGDDLPALVNRRGQGRCAITLDPARREPGQQPYQGVVPLHGDRREPLQQVAQVLEHYMLQSEQLDTRLVLAADDRVAAGLLIQRVPLQGEANLARSGIGAADEDQIGRNEHYNRIAHLAASLTAVELLALAPREILRRLFWQETVRLFEPMQPRFGCRCSRGRVGGMLLSLGRGEVDSVLAERGAVEVGCEFCGAQYRFDAVDVGELFTPPADQAPGSRAVN